MSGGLGQLLKSPLRSRRVEPTVIVVAEVAADTM